MLWHTPNLILIQAESFLMSMTMKTPKEPKHYPKPDYPFCNAGHQLVEVYNILYHRYEWDCPPCIEKMRLAEES